MPRVSAPSPVERISHDGMAEMLEVDADLVGATGAGLAFHEGFSLERSEDPVLGDRFPAAFGDRHFLPVDGMASDRGLDLAVRHAGDSLDEREIGFFHQAVGELPGERLVGGVGFCDDEASAGFLVEPVDDAGPLDPADHAQAGAVEKQGVDQSAFRVSGTGMHDQPGRLVQHENRGVFMEDVERDVLRFGFSGFDFVGNRHAHFVSGTERLGWPGCGAVQEHAPLADECLEAHTGKSRQHRAQIPVQAEAPPPISHNPCFAVHSGFSIAGSLTSG